MFGGKSLDIPASQREKWPYDFSFGVKGSESARTGVAENSHEHCLDLVVQGVSGGNRSPEQCGLLAQERPACDAPLMLGCGRASRSSRNEGDAELAAPTANKIECALCGRAGAVVEAGYAKRRPLVGGNCRGAVKQDHRIDAARNREEHAVEPGERGANRAEYIVSFMSTLCHGILIYTAASE
jgi:hypothetical protein